MSKYYGVKQMRKQEEDNAPKCECSDPGCPVCKGKCKKKGTTRVRRIDMEDKTGFLMCERCAADAYDSGVF